MPRVVGFRDWEFISVDEFIRRLEPYPMNKIICYSNWCWIDRLDDIDLKDGEMLFVRFPDGTAHGVEVIVETKTVRVSEQGSGSFDATSSRAFAEIDYHGVPAKIPLVGLEARRV